MMLNDYDKIEFLEPKCSTCGDCEVVLLSGDDVGPLGHDHFYKVICRKCGLTTGRQYTTRSDVISKWEDCDVSPDTEVYRIRDIAYDQYPAYIEDTTTDIQDAIFRTIKFEMEFEEYSSSKEYADIKELRECNLKNIDVSYLSDLERQVCAYDGVKSLRKTFHGYIINNKFNFTLNHKWNVSGRAKWYRYKSVPQLIEKYILKDDNSSSETYKNFNEHFNVPDGVRGWAYIESETKLPKVAKLFGKRLKKACYDPNEFKRETPALDENLGRLARACVDAYESGHNYYIDYPLYRSGMHQILKMLSLKKLIALDSKFKKSKHSSYPIGATIRPSTELYKMLKPDKIKR